MPALLPTGGIGAALETEGLGYRVSALDPARECPAWNAMYEAFTRCVNPFCRLIGTYL